MTWGLEDQAKLDATQCPQQADFGEMGKSGGRSLYPFAGQRKQILEKEQDEMVTKGSSAAKSSP